MDSLYWDIKSESCQHVTHSLWSGENWPNKKKRERLILFCKIFHLASCLLSVLFLNIQFHTSPEGLRDGGCYFVTPQILHPQILSSVKLTMGCQILLASSSVPSHSIPIVQWLYFLKIENRNRMMPNRTYSFRLILFCYFSLNIFHCTWML